LIHIPQITLVSELSKYFVTFCIQYYVSTLYLGGAQTYFRERGSLSDDIQIIYIFPGWVVFIKAFAIVKFV